LNLTEDLGIFFKRIFGLEDIGFGRQQFRGALLILTFEFKLSQINQRIDLRNRQTSRAEPHIIPSSFFSLIYEMRIFALQVMYYFYYLKRNALDQGELAMTD